MTNEHVRLRLQFMGIGENQSATLVAAKPIVSSLIGGGLDRFYANARSFASYRAACKGGRRQFDDWNNFCSRSNFLWTK